MTISCTNWLLGSRLGWGEYRRGPRCPCGSLSRGAGCREADRQSRRDAPFVQESFPAEAPTVEPESLIVAVVQSLADAVVATDDDGLITVWTGAAGEIFGWPAEEIVGQPMTTILPGWEQGRDSLTGRRRDGSVFRAELTSAQGTHAGERFVAVVVRDATARAAAEVRLRAEFVELERSNFELQQFASVASHDLSEPLRIVDGYLGLLRRRYGGQLDREADEFISLAVGAVARMQRLIDNLLRYARAGEGGPRRERVDLAAVVDETLAVLATVVKRSSARVSVAELPVVQGDPTLIRQVFQNLIGNAVRFTREGEPPQIDISATRQGDAWEISVADCGVGVHEDATERIFEMFGRGRGSGRSEPGSGIGLAICKRAIEAHGGSIRVGRSQCGGADFRFVLPDSSP